MATGGQVLTMLVPDSGWVVYGDNYDSIEWFHGAQVTKAEFEAGFSKYDAWKAEQDAIREADKAAVIAKLGITADEAKLLLG